MSWRFVARLAVPAGLAAWFVAFSLSITRLYVGNPEVLFLDGRLYTAAARAWLEGQNPWTVSVAGTVFAAPPPTLLFALPFVPFGDSSGLVIAVILAISVVWAVRRLGLSPIWLVWPPLVEGVLVANPDVLVLALLVSGRWPAEALSFVAKAYAILPLVLRRRRAGTVAAIAVVVLTAPLLPWGQYFESFSDVSGTLAGQSLGTLSAFGQPVLFALTAGALLMLGQRAAWLVVPALWPWTQLHYAAMSLPIASSSAILALALALPFPYAASIGVLAYVAWQLIRVRGFRIAVPVLDRATDAPS